MKSIRCTRQVGERRVCKVQQLEEPTSDARGCCRWRIGESQSREDRIMTIIKFSKHGEFSHDIPGVKDRTTPKQESDSVWSDKNG